MGPKHSQHEKKPKKGENNNRLAVFLDDSDPIFQSGFGLNRELGSQRPVLPEAVPPLPVPSNPAPSRQQRPPVVPRRSESHLAPPVPPHSSSAPNLHQQVSPSKSVPICSAQPKSIASSRHASEHCMHEDTKPKLLVVQSRFIARTAPDSSEMSVEEGELLYLLRESSSDWWYVSNRSGKVQGHVPKSHVALAEVREPWFAGNISSTLAEQRVMQPGLPIGTFLIRQNVLKNTFVLTVRSSDSDTPRAYTIYPQRDKNGFEMRDPDGRVIIIFKSLVQLVSHFSSEKRPGEVQICTRLSQPAPPLSEPPEYVAMKQWQVDRREVHKQKVIGKGQFGEVFLAKWRNVDVAVKMLREDQLEELSNRQFLEEAKTLTNLAHQHVIRLLAVCVSDQPYLIITEFLKNGSLHSWLLKLRASMTPVPLMSEKTSTKNVFIGASIAAQIASGMDYLAANQIVHRDLATRNVLVGEVSSNGVPLVKVADFGLARKVDTKEREYAVKTDNPMPWRWVAPEAFTTERYNTKTDVWSYGILLWEIGTFGKTPYQGMDYEGTKESLKAVNMRCLLERPPLVPEDVYENVFLECVNLDPDKRPTFSQLFKYFDDINFGNLSDNRGVILPHH